MQKNPNLLAVSIMTFGLSILSIFVLRFGFNVPPLDNSAATVLSQIKKTTQKVFLLGGFDSTSPNFLNDVFSSTDGKNWKLISPQDYTTTTKWSPRLHFGSNTVYFNNKIWVIGGGMGSGSGDEKEVWSSVDGVNWTLMTNNGPDSINHNVVVFNNKIFILNAELDKVSYSSDGINWSVPYPAPWGYRAWASAVVFQNKIWVMGGMDNGIFKNDIWSSSDGLNWTHIDTNLSLKGIQNAPWEARGQHTSLVFNNKIWVLGGCGSNSGCPNITDIWSSPDGINWTLVLADAPWATHYVSNGTSFPDVIYDHSSFVLNGKMFIVHGESPSLSCGIQGCVSMYGYIWSSSDGINWTKVTPTGDLISPRIGLSTVVIPVSDLQK